VTDYFLNERRLCPDNAVAALITVDDSNYLLQLRDQKPEIFYPGHWGLFGGAIDAGESPEQSIRRELKEELGLTAGDIRYFTEFEFDFAFSGHQRLIRRFFEVPLERFMLAHLTLGEGRKMKLFTAREILTSARVVPFDSFALWLHAARPGLERGAASRGGKDDC
jgi:8-oxo-dGTP pyrophosphatase MutT (NUDIX family)